MRLPCAESGSGAHVMRFLQSLVGRISLWCTRKMSQGADVCKEMPFCTRKISEGKNLRINVKSRLFTHTHIACPIFGSNWYKLYCFSHQMNCRFQTQLVLKSFKNSNSSASLAQSRRREPLWRRSHSTGDHDPHLRSCDNNH